jgi:hypothetical protein
MTQQDYMHAGFALFADGNGGKAAVMTLASP